MKTLDALALIYLTFHFIVFVVMAILQYRWRIPGIPFRERFHGGQQFIRDDRIGLYTKMFNVWIVVLTIPMIMLGAYAIVYAIRGF